MVVFNELIEFILRVKVIICPPTVKSLAIYSHFPVDTRFCLLLIFLSGSLKMNLSASEMVLKFIELRIMLVETTHLTQVE